MLWVLWQIIHNTFLLSSSISILAGSLNDVESPVGFCYIKKAYNDMTWDRVRKVHTLLSVWASEYFVMAMLDAYIFFQNYLACGDEFIPYLQCIMLP